MKAALLILLAAVPGAAFTGTISRGVSVSHRRLVATDSATTTAPTTTDKLDSSGIDLILDADDEARLLAESTFPIKPDELIGKCKSVIRAQRDGLQDGSLDEV